MPATTAPPKQADNFDGRLRLQVYRYMIRHGGAPLVAEMARTFSCSVGKVRESLERLTQSHAFMMQEEGELWRVAPFSAISTAFPVRVGRRSWFGNCIWDALGIPAMLHKDAKIDAACACCNYEMGLEVRKGRLWQNEGIIHIAVPARDWYKDVVFT
jgi:alkylmercury lyase-like protein